MPSLLAKLKRLVFFSYETAFDCVKDFRALLVSLTVLTVRVTSLDWRLAASTFALSHFLSLVTKSTRPVYTVWSTSLRTDLLIL